MTQSWFHYASHRVCSTVTEGVGLRVAMQTINTAQIGMFCSIGAALGAALEPLGRTRIDMSSALLSINYYCHRPAGRLISASLIRQSEHVQRTMQTIKLPLAPIDAIHRLIGRIYLHSQIGLFHRETLSAGKWTTVSLIELSCHDVLVW